MYDYRIGWTKVLLAGAALLGAYSDGWGQIITTVAGGGVGYGGPASQAHLASCAGRPWNEPMWSLWAR